MVKNAQLEGHKSKGLYAKKIFDLYKEYFLKQFTIHSPYSDTHETIEFSTKLGTRMFRIIKTKLKNFKLKSSYSGEELDHHLWNYIKTIADSILDRELVILSVNCREKGIQKKARLVIEKKYRGRILNRFSELLQSTGTVETAGMSGFELEEWQQQEIRELTGRFMQTKFTNIINSFEKKSTAIFSKYLESGINNFCIDYIRQKSARKMKRLVIYRDDLPGLLFEQLKDLKGYGTLFYYKKKYDCLTIRDTGKALSVIKKQDFPGLVFEDIKDLFRKCGRRAEYQRIIDNVTAYIKENCGDPKCSSRLLPKHIKALLYINDYVMQKLLKQTEKDIEKAKKRLENCVSCMGIQGYDFKT